MGKLNNKVVVITGATSEVGRATAIEFAKRKVLLVLAAHREDTLLGVAKTCRHFGAITMCLPTDVSNAAQLRHVAKSAFASFGRIDIWINNAAVSKVGGMEGAPTEAIKRVIDANLMGYIHGVRAVIPYFRELGQGVLVNVSSMIDKTCQPVANTYVSTKEAILHLSNSIREELYDVPNIKLATVLPPSIDTLILPKSAHSSGWKEPPFDPVYPAQKVAKTIVKAAVASQWEIDVNNTGRMIASINRFMPFMVENIFSRPIDAHRLIEQSSRPSAENIISPSEHTRASGSWKKDWLATFGRTITLASMVSIVGIYLRSQRFQTSQDMTKVTRKTIRQKANKDYKVAQSA